MQENRVHPRFKEKGIISIKIVSAPEQADLEGATFFSLSGDVSSGGLSFSSHIAPSVGTMLDIRAVFSEPNQTIGGLTGRVAWIKKIPNGTRFMVGVDLKKSDPARFFKWKKIIGERIGSD